MVAADAGGAAIGVGETTVCVQAQKGSKANRKKKVDRLAFPIIPAIRTYSLAQIGKYFDTSEQPV